MALLLLPRIHAGRGRDSDTTPRPPHPPARNMLVIPESGETAAGVRVPCCVYAPSLRNVEVQRALYGDPVRRREEVVHQDQQVALQLKIEVEIRGHNGTTDHHRHGELPPTPPEPSEVRRSIDGERLA